MLEALQNRAAEWALCFASGAVITRGGVDQIAGVGCTLTTNIEDE